MQIRPITLALSVLFCVNVAATAAPSHLKVHLAQANNRSPYAFVRAKFEPGEVSDPWAVRFADARGNEVPFFVWDSITWQCARDGRADWGHRYALLNHAPGNAFAVRTARARKLAWAATHRPKLGARLAAQDASAKKQGSSVCAALYLLRRTVPALGKDRLMLQIDPDQRRKPKRQYWKGRKVRERVAVKRGELVFRGLPDRLSVSWKGKELLRCDGFDAGGTTGSASHTDPSRPFTIETTTGLITKLVVTGQTRWRQDGAMNWQCTYWLLPEGSYVALEGFSLLQGSQYRGGPQKLSIFAPPEGVAGFTEKKTPVWDRPWWLHRVGGRGWVASHLFHATPLSIGYGNNPFTVNAEGRNKDPRVELNGKRLALRWFHQVNDPAISRLMGATPVINGRPVANNSSSADRKTVIRWEPKNDWLYRQYLIGTDDKPEAAEAALRDVLGAAAGWIDRPVSEEQVASLLVSMTDEIGRHGRSAEIGLLRIVPAVLKNDSSAIRAAMRDRLLDYPARTDFYINTIRKSVAAGHKPAGGSKLRRDRTRQEGWTGNPCYHASLMPCYVRVLEHFEVPFARNAYQQSILRYANFGLELLGGRPVDFERFRKTLEGEWPSRVVPTIPLMLHAYTLKPKKEYARAAKMLFDNLFRLVQRNPHGYFPVWTYHPRADKYDTGYNPVSYERGITSFWSEDLLTIIGRKRASQFVAAQARWFVYSGQLLDTLETDNATAIRACTHGGHTGLRNQIGIYLHDDFEFYRGLVSDLVSWSAASGPPPSRQLSMGTAPYRKLELSNAGSSMLRWALDIRPASKYRESKVKPLVKQNGFRLEAWNRHPDRPFKLSVKASEVGLKADREVLQFELKQPAFRRPAAFEVTREAGKAVIKVSAPAKIRLSYHTLWPDWRPGTILQLQRRPPKGRASVVTGSVRHEKGVVEWSATPGVYELRGP